MYYLKQPNEVLALIKEEKNSLGRMKKNVSLKKESVQ